MPEVWKTIGPTARTLTEEERAVVYYTAMLINVGCHTDAHEQAKWFWDDLSLKSTKYDHPVRSLRGMAAGLKTIGTGHPLIQRFRIGVEFAVAGHRELDDMLDHHAQMARSLADQLGLPPPVLEAIGAAYEQWNGKGWPGELRGEEVPTAARIAQIAEFAEAAHRVGGVADVRKFAEKRWSGQFDPRLVRALVADADLILADLDQVQTWDAVIEAEPSLAVFLTDDEFEGALEAVANFVDLKSPYFAIAPGYHEHVRDLTSSTALMVARRLASRARTTDRVRSTLACAAIARLRSLAGDAAALEREEPGVLELPRRRRGGG